MKEKGCSVYEKKEAERYLKQSCLGLSYKSETRRRVISLYECDYSVLDVLTITDQESNKTCGDYC